MPDLYGLQHPPHQRLPVAWYALPALWQLVREMLWSTKLLRNLDRRETFTGPFECNDLRGLATPEEPDLWIDFMADTGDGGNATTAVAQGLLAPVLQADGAPQPLPEGRLLVLGGDLAYPAATPEAYQSRLVEMFELARHRGSRFVDVPRGLAHGAPLDPRHKLLAALPQNHDWFDSASTFCRYFVNEEKAGLVGARAPQRRTYFALLLPHRWALLGLDFALSGDIDRRQYEALDGLLHSGSLAPGTQVILLLPEPVWTRPLADQERPAYPTRLQRLEHRLAESGCTVRLRLAGDLHCYARDQLPAVPPQGLDSQLVVCGSGGAFGHGTHGLEFSQPKALRWCRHDPHAAQPELQGRLLVGRVPPGRAVPGQASTAPCRYPDTETSYRSAWANLWALLRPGPGRLAQSNLDFSLGMGALLCVAALAPVPWAALALAVLGLTGLVIATDNEPGRVDAATGSASAALLAALAALALGWRHAGPDLPTWAWPALWLGASVVCGGLFGLMLVTVGALLGRSINNSASALDGQDHKGFVRMRLGPDGLECWMLGCDQVPRRWVPASAPDARPYWQPAPGQPALRWRVVDHFHLRTPGF